MRLYRSNNTLYRIKLKTKESTDFSDKKGAAVLTFLSTYAIILKAFQAEAMFNLWAGRIGKR